MATEAPFNYLQVRLSSKLRHRLDTEAKKRGIKSTELTRALILGFCEKQHNDDALSLRQEVGLD
jgi:hypothetical protein